MVGVDNLEGVPSCGCAVLNGCVVAYRRGWRDTGGVRERSDFFISHAGADRAWAEWVAWQLTDAGYSVELDVWDWAAGQNFVAAMSDALGQ